MENNLKCEIQLKREIPLKQDTPMWHFQPNQSGCCLRATEVKPKLDKFLEKLDGFQKNYYLDKSKNNALDYKLWFEPIGEKISLNVADFPLFFANTGVDDRDKKQLLYYPKGVKMHLFSFNAKLLDFVEKNLPAFFAYHSFGTRQDKGFGFFSRADVTNKVFEQEKLWFSKIELPSIFLSELQFKFLFKAINNVHNKTYKPDSKDERLKSPITYRPILIDGVWNVFLFIDNNEHYSKCNFLGKAPKKQPKPEYTFEKFKENLMSICETTTKNEKNKVEQQKEKNKQNKQNKQQQTKVYCNQNGKSKSNKYKK